MISKILQYIQDSILKSDTGLKFLQISGAHGKKFELGRIVLLFFRDGEENPFLVSKFYKDSCFNEQIEKEFEKTEYLYRKLGNLVAKPICVAPIEDKLVLFEEFIYGKTLSGELDSYIHCPVFKEEKINSFVIEGIHRVSEIFESLKTIEEESSQNLFQCEIEKLKKDFIDHFSLNEFEVKALEKLLNQLPDNFSEYAYRQRIVNFDFTPFNVILGNDRCKMIDMEFSQKSSLIIMEHLRFIYYIFKQLHENHLYRFSDDLIHDFYIFVTDMSNEVSVALNDLIFKFQNIRFNRDNRNYLLVLFLMAEAELQFSTTSYVSKEMKLFWKKYINYLSGYYLYDEVFSYDLSPLGIAYRFASIKDQQIKACEVELEKRDELIKEHEAKLNEKQRNFDEISVLYGNTTKELEHLKEQIQIRDLKIEEYEEHLQNINRSNKKLKEKIEDTSKLLSEYEERINKINSSIAHKIYSKVKRILRRH